MSIIRRLDPRNWKVATRLFAGFGLSVAFTVCACLVAWSNFMQSEQAMRTIELKTISGMVNALKTASEQSALSALAPDLSRVVSDDERRSISNQLDQQITKIRSLLDNFQTDPNSDDLQATMAVVEEIDGELNRLDEEAVAALNARDTRKAALKRVVDKHAAAIESLEGPLEDAFLYMMMDASDIVETTAADLGKLVESQLAATDLAISRLRSTGSTVDIVDDAADVQEPSEDAAKTASARAEEIGQANKQGVRGLLTDGVNEINTLFAAKSEVNFSAGMLVAAGNADDAEALSDIEERFRASITALRGSLGVLDTANDFPEVDAAMADLIGEGEGEASVFVLRRDEFAVAAELERLVSRQNQLTSRFNDLSEGLVANAQDGMARETAALREHLAWSSSLLLILALVSAAMGLFAAIAITRSVVRPIVTISHAVGELAKGEDVSVPGIQRQDEIGILARAMDQVYQKGLEAARLKSALDSCKTMFLVADAESQIIHLNPALIGFIEVHDQAFAAVIPEAGPSALRSSHLSVFADALDLTLVDEALDPASSGGLVQCGDRRLQIDCSSVRNDKNEDIGFVIEWTDRTLEYQVREQIDDVLENAAEGQLGRRLELEGADAGYARLVEGVNALSDLLAGTVNEYSRVFLALSAGDLESRVEGTFKGAFRNLKDNVNTTIDRLDEVVRAIRKAASDVSGSVQDIRGQAVEIASRADEASLRIEETASALEEISSVVNSNADNCKHAAAAALLTDKNAKEGDEIVCSASDTMREIEQAFENVDGLVEIIEGIANKTRLISLNANVEAARAGEAGRGFSVVADEVKELSNQVTKASADVREILVECRQTVKSGVERSGEASSALQDIVRAAKDVDRQVESIETATNEQAIGVSEIANAMALIDAATQRTNDVAQQGATSAEHLESLSAGLIESVAFFSSEPHEDNKVLTIAS